MESGRKMAEWLDKILAKEEIYNPIIIGQSIVNENCYKK